MLAQDYTPTEADVLKCHAGKYDETDLFLKPGTTERFSARLRLTRVVQKESNTRKWIQHFADVTGIIFTVDLAAYEWPLTDEEQTHSLAETLEFFELMINAPCCKATAVILLFYNRAAFEEKLQSNPLIKAFSSPGGGDAIGVMEYLFFRFQQLNRQWLALYPHVVDIYDVKFASRIVEEVREAATMASLTKTGFL